MFSISAAALHCHGLPPDHQYCSIPPEPQSLNLTPPLQIAGGVIFLSDGKAKVILAMLRSFLSENAVNKGRGRNIARYYTKGDTETSSWGGSSARELGLSGEVDVDLFRALLAGKVEGQQLGRHCRDGIQHHPEWDFTISAPKSVLIVAHAISDKRGIAAQSMRSMSRCHLLRNMPSFGVGSVPGSSTRRQTGCFGHGYRACQENLTSIFTPMSRS